MSLLRPIGRHRGGILGVTAAPDGRLVTACGFHDHLAVWGDSAREAEREVRGGGVCWMAAMSVHGVVAAGFGDLTVRLWRPATGEVHVLGVLEEIVATLAWSADGRRLFTGSCGDNTVRLWDVEARAVVAAGKTKRSATWHVALSGDGRRGVSGAGDKLVHVWDAEDGREVAALAGHTGRITGLSLVGGRLVSASQDRTAIVWDLDRGVATAALAGHRKAVAAVALSPSGVRVATAANDGSVRVWDAETGAELSRVATVGPTSVAWIGEAEVAVGHADGTLAAWTP